MALHLRTYLAELKRRKVYKVAAAYAVVAFGLWQIADIAFPSLGLPPNAVTLVLVLTLLGFPVALILAWAYDLQPERPPDAGSVPGATALPGAAARGVGARLPESAIAVLPFESMAAETDSTYFADGVTEELTHALARVHGLRVAARTSAFAFRGKHGDVREIARALDVRYVVEGSVRRSGERLRVAAQLIEAETGYHVWSERYERPLGDVFEVQDEIVENVTASLLRHLPKGEDPVAVPVDRTPDMLAYDAYLRGRHQRNRFDPAGVQAAEREFEEARRLDPEFASAHAALAEIYCLQAIAFGSAPPALLMGRARAAAERALELVPDLPEAHMALGVVHLFHEWDFHAARRVLEEAVRLSPSSADSHLWLEFYYTYAERDYERATAALERALALNPLDPACLDRRGTLRMIFGDYTGAEADFRTLIDRHAHPRMAALGLADLYSRRGRMAEAVVWGQKALGTDPAPTPIVGVVGGVFAMAGRRDEAARLLAELETRQEQGYVPSFWLAGVHAALGNTDRAFELLDRAIEDRDGGVIYLTAVPRAYGLHDDPRFPDVLRRIGLGHLLPALTPQPAE